MNSYQKKEDYLPHAYLYPSTDLDQFHSTVFIFFALIQFSQFFFSSNFQLFGPEVHWRDLSSRNAHLVHQIGIVFVLHFNPWVEASAGGL
jgi:hypothetical protein